MLGHNLRIESEQYTINT